MKFQPISFLHMALPKRMVCNTPSAVGTGSILIISFFSKRISFLVVLTQAVLRWIANLD